jgi:hypothetical protein
MEKKQSPVDYLVTEIENIGFSSNNTLEFYDTVQVAKEMEETEYKERLVKEFNPRLFNKPSKELPTDEEIYELAEKMLAVDYLSFTEGAKWMRDKIKGGNNE